MKTVFITGASTGIGLACAEYFHQQGWRVVATMRDPSRCDSRLKLPNVLVLPLDVTEMLSIENAVKEAFLTCGHIDAVINNAGYGLIGAFETFSDAQMRRQMDTNFFGILNVTKAFLPHFREQRHGCFVNITSVAGRVGFPWFSLYCASKFAVEGFTEALRFELEPFNIKVKLVEPGPVRTDFNSRSAENVSAENHPAYRDEVSSGARQFAHVIERGTSSAKIAEVIYRAATCPQEKFRFAGDVRAAIILLLRKLLPDAILYRLIKRS